MLIPGLGIGSIYGMLLHPGSTEQFVRLGYPVYLAPFLGVARILALIVIVNPKFPRLKEWAYAGLSFDVIGAMYSQIASGQSLTSLFFPAITILLLSGSYLGYHKRLAFGNAHQTDLI